MLSQLRYHMHKLEVDTSQGPDLAVVLDLQRDRAKTLEEMAQKSVYFYQDFDAIDEAAAKKHLKPQALTILAHLTQLLSDLASWTEDNIHQAIEDVCKEFEIGMGKVAQPLRVAITGNTFSPSITQTAYLIGQERVMARLAEVQKGA